MFDQTAPRPATGSAYRDRLYRSYVSTHLVGRHPCSLGDFARLEPWFHAQIGRYLPPRRDAAILDVGCGNGPLLWFLQRQGYTNVHGVDVSPEQLGVARSLGLSQVEQVEAREYLLAHRAEFDVIMAFDVLEHLAKDEVLAFLDAVNDALKVGGWVVIHTANGEGPFGTRYLYGDFTHQTAFTARSIDQLLGEAGLSDILVREVQPVPHGFISAIRWALWQLIRGLLIGYLAVETGVVRGHTLSQNLIAVAQKR
jgi:2-polyprenyl-3-methyl-5-hydroxy-6-metoxy-1,4-benzoquinol methylase